MSTLPDNEQTLPSVVAAFRGQYRETALVLSIVFHPDASRIGDSARLPCQDNGQRWLLGRYRPEFIGGEQDQGRPLDELHISRQALEFVFADGVLTVRKMPESSRCRIGGRELKESRVFEREQLRPGVPILLSHSVVLLLSLRDSQRDGGVAVEPDPALLGSSDYMAALRERIIRAADSDSDVLVLGETGTGKELVASAIHSNSRRKDAPLVNVNMSAIPPELAPAALFGSARGAFTGANKATAGYFQEAEGGTLLLDEIGDTPPAIQPQLLRALQQREIQAVGGPVRHADIRVVSATDAVLDDADCDFKAALRHRLGAFEIRLLPLREHPEDVGELLLHFLTEALERTGRQHLLPTPQSPAPDIAAWAELFHDFLCYHWPGNVRELSNFARQVALASELHLVVPEHILEDLRKQSGTETPPSIEPAATPLRKMRDVGEEEFAAAYSASHFEKAETARVLGVSRQSVYRRLERSADYRLVARISMEELARVLAAVGGDVVAAAEQLGVSVAGLRARLSGSELEWH